MRSFLDLAGFQNLPDFQRFNIECKLELIELGMNN